MYIIVVGGGSVGSHLTAFLLSEGHEALLIEKDKHKIPDLSGQFGEALLEGNGSRISVLSEGGANRADVLIAVTGNDEDNLIICQIAKTMFKCPRTISRVNDPRNENLFSALGVNATVNATRLIDALIEEQVHADSMVIPLVALPSGRAEIIEVALSASSRWVGKTVDAIPLPDGVALTAILRGEEIFVPTPEFSLAAQDKIVALIKKEAEPLLRDLF